MITTTTPPETRKEIVLKGFNEDQLIDVLKKMSPQLLHEINISVWALDPKDPKGCVNILSEDLPFEKIPELLEKVRYVTYSGDPFDLKRMGVI